MALTPCLGLWGPGPPWELPGQGWAEPCGVEAGLRASQELGEAASCPSVIPGAEVSSSRGDRQGGPCGPGDGGRLGLGVSCKLLNGRSRPRRRPCATL